MVKHKYTIKKIDLILICLKKPGYKIIKYID